MQLRFAPGDLGRITNSIASWVRDEGGRAYAAGGATRDARLGRAATDIDLEVYGIDPGHLADHLAGYGPLDLVGLPFGVIKVAGLPVDVTIPRTEAKSGAGHRGFTVHPDPSLDTRTASARRDFTVNALLLDVLTGEVVDHWGGLDDLDRRVLRHITPAFADDPLRVLRAMQFVARFELSVDPLTLSLCRTMDPGEIGPERGAGEWRKLLLAGRRPSLGLRFLDASGWIDHYPELAALRGVPQDPEWHPEGDVFVHTGHALDAAAAERTGTDDWPVALAVLAHDLGKALTTEMIRDRWRSYDHDQAGVQPARSLLARLAVDGATTDLVAVLVATHLRPAQLHLAGAGDAAVRRLARAVGRLDLLVRVARADANGRPPLPYEPFDAGAWLLDRAEALDVTDHAPRPLVTGHHLIEHLGAPPGPELGRVLREVFEAQLDGRVTTVDDGVRLADALLRAGPGPAV